MSHVIHNKSIRSVLLLKWWTQMSCSFNHCIDNCYSKRNRTQREEERETKKMFRWNASINFKFKSVSIRKMLRVSSLLSLTCIGCLKDVHYNTSTLHTLLIYVANARSNAKAFHLLEIEFDLKANWSHFFVRLLAIQYHVIHPG